MESKASEPLDMFNSTISSGSDASEMDETTTIEGNRKIVSVNLQQSHGFQKNDDQKHIRRKKPKSKKKSPRRKLPDLTAKKNRHSQST